ncbi:MAG: hypothetical protein CRU78_08225 [Candidatus Accumulibacter phosphatis]|uniref:Uncharacterized protein n=1 Tax=Candidatus Accumulibacter phosphatis TaxID=327160 RepID=A0A6A7RSF6_9PROT|nr:hypothetical protein [Candidatus Accumulibacter phosphatis]
MLVLRDQENARRIAAPEIRRLVEQRFLDICAGEPYEPDLHGYVIVVEAGDSVQDLEEESGCPLYGAAGSSPCFEVLEELDTCYEMVFVPGDGDFGIVIFIPKQDDIDPDLLVVCAEYAVPAP